MNRGIELGMRVRVATGECPFTRGVTYSYGRICAVDPYDNSVLVGTNDASANWCGYFAASYTYAKWLKPDLVEILTPEQIAEMDAHTHTHIHGGTAMFSDYYDCPTFKAGDRVVLKGSDQEEGVIVGPPDDLNFYEVLVGGEKTYRCHVGSIVSIDVEEEPQCVCGSEAVYGENATHSHWCPLA